MNIDIGFLISLVYGIVETLEKFGLKRKYAHLLAFPLGILGSFLYLKLGAFREYIAYGLLIGLASTGTCDTLCNAFEIGKRIKEKKT